jgi:hypothetical protein
MSPSMSDQERDLRNDFDFSRGVRGKYAERYRRGHRVVLLDDQPEGSAEPASQDGQLTEIAGRHLLIANLISAGLEVAEPIRDNGIDLIAYSGRQGSEDFVARPIQLKAYSHESFALDGKYDRIPHLLIAYVWNVREPQNSEIYALTFQEALGILEERGYARTDSWTQGRRYFVRSAGRELKKSLERFKMTRERWQEKFKAA